MAVCPAASVVPMRVVVRDLGQDIPSGLGQLCVEQDPSPPNAAALGIGEVLVHVFAASVNFPDLLMTCGRYQYKPEPPYTPGTEAAGIVAGVGADVTHIAAGDRVICARRCGMMQSFVIVAAVACMPLPPGLDFAEGASFNVAYSTAYHCLVERARLEPRDAVLINGATGGVGFAAVQLARALGCTTVVATGTSAARLEALRAAGASDIVDLAATPVGGLADAVKALTGGRGVDVVFDPVGGEIFEQSLRATAWGARVAIVGFAGGDNSRSIRANYALIKGLAIFGCRAGESIRRGAAVEATRMSHLYRLVAEGKLKPHVSHRFPVEQAKAAFEVLQNRQVVGKCVVTFEDAAVARESKL